MSKDRPFRYDGVDRGRSFRSRSRIYRNSYAELQRLVDKYGFEVILRGLEKVCSDLVLKRFMNDDGQLARISAVRLKDARHVIADRVSLFRAERAAEVGTDEGND